MLVNMRLERVRSWFWSLNKFDSVVALLIVSIVLLLFFRLPVYKHFRGIHFNGTMQYLIITGIGIALVIALGVPTNSYFGKPHLRGVGLLALVIAGASIALTVSSGYMIHQPLRFKIAGIIFLLAIGFSEEFIDRILIFGSLRRFGLRFGVIVSSLIFGLTHLNVYLPNWDTSEAIYHVCSATGFGLLACGILLATRSYWIVAIFHGLSDWTIIFDGKTNLTEGPDYSPSVLESIRWGFESFFLEYGLMGLFLLYCVRGKWPKWVIRLAVKWKLVE